MTAQEQAANVNRLANIPSATDCERGDEHARRPQKAPWQKVAARCSAQAASCYVCLRAEVAALQLRCYRSRRQHVELSAPMKPALQRRLARNRTWRLHSIQRVRLKHSIPFDQWTHQPKPALLQPTSQVQLLAIRARALHEKLKELLDFLQMKKLGPLLKSSQGQPLRFGLLPRWIPPAKRLASLPQVHLSNQPQQLEHRWS